MQIGKHHTLEVLRDTPSGLFLGDEEGNDVLLPGKYIPPNTKVGDHIEVFIYKDHQSRLIATTLEPKIKLHQFELLGVKMTNQYGAFMDWGIEKDLFVPFKEQNKKMLEGRYYVVFMYIDDQTDRLVGSARINRFLDNEEIDLEEGEEVEILIWEATDIGYNVIVNQEYKGLIYDNEIFTQLRPGMTKKAYVKKIREDNKLDIILQKSGYENVEPNAQKILEMLNERDGFLPLTDKSAPDEIVFYLEMSKKMFKKAIGGLYKKKMIRLEKDGIYLSEKTES